MNNKSTKNTDWKSIILCSVGIIILTIILINQPVSTNYDANDITNNCKTIGSAITSSAFQEQFRYIDAEAQDLRDQKKSGDLTNVEYQEEIDEIRDDSPRGFVWVDATISSYQEDMNRYILKVSYPLPDPMLPGVLAALRQTAYLDLGNFSELNNQSFREGNKVRVLVTNLNSSDPTHSWFYYSVVSIEWNGGILTGAEYCS